MDSPIARLVGRTLARVGLPIAIISAAAMSGAQPFVPHRLLLKFTPGTSVSAAQQALASCGAQVQRELPQIGVKVVSLPPNANEQAIAHALLQRPNVQFAEPDFVRNEAQVVPNDPWFANWQTELTKIDCQDAWTISLGNPSIIVAVLDTGVEATHPDLAGNLVAGWNVYSNSSDTSDLFGHGTAVAGTIGAISNNGVGVASVAWNCRLMPIRICSSSSASSTDSVIAAGINYAADHGAKVANVSYDVGGSSTFASACQYFQNHGGVVTVSAGNSGVQISYAANPYYLVVGATTSSDTLATYSNYGTPIALVAPGYGYTTTLGGTYGSVGGTSFSAPLVAGVAALMESANSSLSGAQIMSLLKGNCDDLGAAGWDMYFGYGRLNAYKALSAAMNTSGNTITPAVSFNQPSNGITLQGNFTLSAQASDSLGISAMTITIDGAQVASSSSGSCSYGWNTNNAANGNHTLVATARDSGGNTSSSTVTISVENVVDTTPPSVSITSPAAGTRIGRSVSVSVNASDNVGVTKVELYVDGALKSTSTSAPFSLSWNSSKAASGTHNLQCKAYDAAGNTSLSQIVQVTK